MLDTSTYNDIARDEEFRDLVMQARKKGFIKIITTNVQIDQISDMAPSSQEEEMVKEKMVALINLSGTIETSGSFPSWFKKGWSNPGFTDFLNPFMGNRNVNKKNEADALIAATAAHKNYTFVINDNSIKNKYEEMGKIVMNSLEFKTYLKKLLQT